MSHTSAYSLLDHRQIKDISQEIKAHLVKNKLPKYKQKLLNHAGRMEDIRHPKQVLHYETCTTKLFLHMQPA
jgi:hypothetical protein